ncbi:MAG: protein phosphatase CheZ [Candidatus Eiseniibacteriota bacterium]
MHIGLAKAQLNRCLTTLRDKQETINHREEVATIVEGVLASLQGDMSAADVRLYHELEQLSQLIQSAKSEIAAIRPEDINEQHIPTATDELDAIVGATEDATGTILDCMEKIEGLTGKMPTEVGTEVGNAVTQVYEACNFQDITGQRISKVVKALKEIEVKIDALVAAFGTQGDGKAKGPAKSAIKDTREDSHLLNGPQLPSNSVSQADIDALLAGSK